MSASSPLHAYRHWRWLLAGWAVFGAVQALLRGALGVRSDISLYNTLAQVIALAVGWAAMTPVIAWWHQRAGRRRLLALFLWHAPVAVLSALAITALRRGMVLLLGGELTIPFQVTLAYFADLTIASYCVAIWAGRALESFDAVVAQGRHTSALRRQLIASQMEYLDLQLRPHFLFNALGSIAELTHEAPGKAARMLENVLALLQSAVLRRGDTLVSLADEVRALEPYLDIQRLRFEDWLLIDLDTDSESLRAFVPPFILQPLVENAVHHGLIRRTERGRITIAARVADGRLRLAVTDNGAGLNAETYAQGRGLGLANIRGRLKTFYGEDCSLDLRAAPEGGTAAQLDVPLLHSSPASAEEAREADVVSPASRGSAVIAWCVEHPVRALLLGWGAVALFRIQHSLGYMWMRDRFSPEAFSRALFHDITVALVWLGLTPLVAAFARTVPLRAPGIPRRMAIHAAAAAIFAFSHALLTRIVAGGMSDPLWQGLDAELYAWNVAIYAVLFLATHYRALELWLRERELTAQRLSVELQEARLNRVMLGLRPMVLFDVLRHLIGLVDTNPRLAEQRLAQLGDFLRATLDGMRHHEVPLAQELEGAAAYVHLMAIATVPGLSLRIDTAPGVAIEPVPNGILRAAIDAVLAGAPERPPEVVHLAVRRIASGLQIAAWQAPAGRSHDGALTEQIAGYLDHGLVEATWNDGQLLLRT